MREALLKTSGIPRDARHWRNSTGSGRGEGGNETKGVTREDTQLLFMKSACVL